MLSDREKSIAGNGRIIHVTERERVSALYEEKTYYDDRIILVRNFRPEDSEIICAGEVAQGWDQTIDNTSTA